MRKTFISFVRITLCIVLFSPICIAQLKDAPYPIGKTFEQSPDGVWASLFRWTLVKKGNLVYGLMALGADRCIRATISGNNLASLDQAKKMIAVRDRKNNDELIDIEFEDIPPAEKAYYEKALKDYSYGLFSGSGNRFKAGSGTEFLSFLQSQVGTKSLILQYEKCFQLMDGVGSNTASRAEEQCKTDPCIPPQYRLVFVGREAGAGSEHGHAYVVLEQFNSSTGDYEKRPYGFFPYGSPELTLSKIVFGRVSGRISEQDQKDNYERKGVYFFRIPVSEQTFGRVKVVIDNWTKETEKKKPLDYYQYQLWVNNCVAFVDDIAKAVGDAPDSRDSDCPNKKTKRLNLSSDDRTVTRPAVYVEHLIELNPNREVPDMLQDCK